MGVVCVYTMMSRASLEKTQWAEGDVWGLESSAASSLTELVPCLDESNGSQWELLIHLGPLVYLDFLTAWRLQGSK